MKTDKTKLNSVLNQIGSSDQFGSSPMNDRYRSTMHGEMNDIYGNTQLISARGKFKPNCKIANFKERLTTGI